MPKTPAEAPPLRASDSDFAPKGLSPKMYAGLRLCMLLFWTFLLLGPLWLSKLFRRNQWCNKIMQFGSRMLLLSIGARVHVSGQLSDKRPLLLVSNHISYLDVCILSACVDVKFTPKNDILKWPLFGTITKLSGAITIDRRPEKIMESKAMMKSHLAKGEVICLFPEATTGDGLSMHPFKSAFFSLCQEEFGEEGDQPLYVQPAAIIYRSISGLPIDRFQWPQLAWYGDMDLAPHLWRLLMLPRIDIELAFLPALDTSRNSDRKQLARQAEQAITKTIEASRQKARNVQAMHSSHFMPKRLRKNA